jgi:hypothetical protein
MMKPCTGFVLTVIVESKIQLPLIASKIVPAASHIKTTAQASNKRPSRPTWAQTSKQGPKPAERSPNRTKGAQNGPKHPKTAHKGVNRGTGAQTGPKGSKLAQGAKTSAQGQKPARRAQTGLRAQTVQNDLAIQPPSPFTKGVIQNETKQSL